MARETVRRFIDVGVDELILVMQNGITPHELTMESIRTFESAALFRMRPRAAAHLRVALRDDYMPDRLKDWARTAKRDVHALYLASRDPRVPWYAKAVAVVVAGYALSPIDLIPDFIPILGFLDDVIVVPLGILLVVRMIPSDVMAEHRAVASAAQERPISRTAAAIIALIWTVSVVSIAWLAYAYFGGSNPG